MKTNNQVTSRNAELELRLKYLEKERDEERAVLEKERDSYFEKLRDIELLPQIHREQEEASCNIQEEAGCSTELIKKIFKVLYATSEVPVAVGNNGEVIYRCVTPLVVFSFISCI